MVPVSVSSSSSSIAIIHPFWRHSDFGDYGTIIPTARRYCSLEHIFRTFTLSSVWMASERCLLQPTRDMAHTHFAVQFPFNISNTRASTKRCGYMHFNVAPFVKINALLQARTVHNNDNHNCIVIHLLVINYGRTTTEFECVVCTMHIHERKSS